MKARTFSGEQVIGALQEADGGATVDAEKALELGLASQFSAGD
jgi:hypothetical protein